MLSAAGAVEIRLALVHNALVSSLIRSRPWAAELPGCG
jgi:hypothetical protein